MPNAEELKDELLKLKDSNKAYNLSRFFKTGKGQYGEGDIFLGITVPVQRLIAGKYTNLELGELKKFLQSEIHEFRLTALIILSSKFRKAQESEKEEIVKFYLANTQYINNWDLVDLSAPNILGSNLLDKDRSVLYKLARSENLWEKRIAIIATLAFIRKGEFGDTFKIAEVLLHDKHDLIQKAVGWMLREVGKKDLDAEFSFLDKHYRSMPRTSLRYSIERFDPEKRTQYLAKI